MTQKPPLCHAIDNKRGYPPMIGFGATMAAIRALLIAIALTAFLLVGVPAQVAVARYFPRARDRIPLLFCRTLLRLLGVEVSVRGTRGIGRPTMVVANHVSWIDILVLGAAAPVCFLAKREVAGWPLLSAFAEVQGTVFVDRKRRRSIPPANAAMARRMLEGRAVVLFPEGTTANLREPGTFRTSHFAAARDLLRIDDAACAVDVQPAAIAYSSPLAAWVGDDALLPHLWRVLRAPRMQCVLSFAPPIAYTRESDRKSVARSSRTVIAAALRQAPAAAPTPYEIAAATLDPVTTSA